MDDKKTRKPFLPVAILGSNMPEHCSEDAGVMQAASAALNVQNYPHAALKISSGYAHPQVSGLLVEQ